MPVTRSKRKANTPIASSNKKEKTNKKQKKTNESQPHPSTYIVAYVCDSCHNGVPTKEELEICQFPGCDRFLCSDCRQSPDVVKGRTIVIHINQGSVCSGCNYWVRKRWNAYDPATKTTATFSYSDRSDLESDQDSESSQEY
jgi:hypothetical protein